MKIRGGGGGLNLKEKDECHFVSFLREAGDFEIVARLADFSGEANAAAGLMVRSDNTPGGAMAALFFKAKDNVTGWLSGCPADPHGNPRVFSGGIELARNRHCG